MRASYKQVSSRLPSDIDGVAHEVMPVAKRGFGLAPKTAAAKPDDGHRTRRDEWEDIAFNLGLGCPSGGVGYDFVG